MREYPPYSVLMSVYSKDDPLFLNESIMSMVKQTVPFHDMVIVCDGPLTAELDEILIGWQKKIAERLVIHRIPENRGLGPALAAGLPLCGCDTVARMDADDVSRSRRCELLLDAMVEGDLCLVGGSIEEFDKKPGDTGCIRHLPSSQYEIEAYSRRRNPFNHMTVVFSRKAVLAAGGYQAFPYLEDYWLWVRMLARGCRCANISEVVLDARVGSGMYTRRRGIRYLKSQALLFRKMRGRGYINRLEELRAIAERTVASFLPPKVLRLAYSIVLRR